MSEAIDTLLDRNAAYAATHEARAPLPTLNTIVVSCTDARIDPAHILGVAPGEAVVLRNAGGRVTHAIEQDIALLVAMASRALGAPARPNVLLVHHTQCGVEMLAKPDAAQAFSQASGIDRRTLEALAIHDHEASLRADLARLAASPLVPAGVRVTGLRYDQTTGLVDVVFSEVLSGGADDAR